MTSNLRDVLQAKAQYDQRFERERLVTLGITVARNGSVQVPNVYDHLWVLPMGIGEPVAVFNRVIKPRANVAVVIGYAGPESTVLEILRTVIITTEGIEQVGLLEVPNHAATHLITGDDPLYIYARAITMLLCYPSNGLSVNVMPYVYRSGNSLEIFGGIENYSLASFQPASGYKVAVLVYLNRSTKTIGAVAGDTFVDTALLTPTAPDVPEGCTPTALINLNGDQTSFEEDDFYDVRDFLYSADVVQAEMSQQLAWIEAEFDFALSKHIVEG